MRGNLRISLATALAAGAALSTLGFAAVGTASASPAGSLAMGRTIFTDTIAGYMDTGRSFRFAAATLTVPKEILPSRAFVTAIVSLVHMGGTTAGPYAQVVVFPGGGAGSVTYESSGGSGTFAVRPRIGDRLRLSVYYDRHGHVFLTVADKTQGVTRTVRKNAGSRIGSLPYNTVALLGHINSQPRPAEDIRLWHYTNASVTTYKGIRGTVLGPWTTRKVVDTTTGTSSGLIVMSPSKLSNKGQDFGVWLRHR